MTRGFPGGGSLPRMVLLAACTSLGPLALNVYLPGLPAVQADFATDLAGVQWTVSGALLAFGLGLVLLGPFADHYGRRPTLLGGLVLFCLGCALAALAPSLRMLLAGRIVASTGAALTFITSRAIVADLTPREHLQRSVAQMTMIMLIVQMVAPMFGNAVIAFGGWRAIQWVLLALGAALGLLVWAQVAETLPAGAAPVRSASLRRLVAPSLALLRRPVFLLLLLQVGFLYSSYPAFVSIAPHLMIDAFHRPPTEYGYYFPCLPLGYFAGNAFVLRFGYRFGQHRLVLLGAVFGMLSVLLGMGLLMHGYWHPLTLFLTAGSLLNLGMGVALPSVSARAVAVAWPNTASGWGLVGFAQQLVAACSVQLLGFFSGSSPYPVLWICLALVAGTFVVECLPRRDDASRILHA